MASSNIGFFTENSGFRPKNVKKIREWLLAVIHAEGKSVGEISFIFCDDNYLHEMNLKYLSHDTLTDVITFDYSEGSILSGDVFISIERVRENAVNFMKPLNDEIHRVMVHGVLHLCGYKDKTKKDSAIMRGKEETYLALFPHH
ncbi:MAG: rRNA maturation RNase YbeY [Bacteroidales bacterium]|nr:rRNA maturation RNase YbeY [Bacteroidales bacterium]MBK9356105.1 rRNA maturation RNase YbeY [Bacteroidales bacterium]